MLYLFVQRNLESPWGQHVDVGKSLSCVSPHVEASFLHLPVFQVDFRRGAGLGGALDRWNAALLSCEVELLERAVVSQLVL